MNDLSIHIEVEPGVDADEVAAAVKAHLAALAEVQDVDVEREETRSLEAVVVIAGAITIVKGTADLITSLRVIIGALRGVLDAVPVVRSGLVGRHARRARLEDTSNDTALEYLAGKPRE